MHIVLSISGLNIRVFKMKNELLQWAMNFFTSVKVVDDVIVSNVPDYQYDIRQAMISLKFILQDSGISRIPPDCKLPHRHYRNPQIHDDLNERLYVVIGKDTINDIYGEFYIRDEGSGYIVGYEAVKVVNGVHSQNPDDRFSNEHNYFEMNPIHKLCRKAAKYLSEHHGSELANSRDAYERHKALSDQLLKDILS